MQIPASIRTLIESGSHAHLVTLNPDGSPQVTVVWIGLEGDVAPLLILQNNANNRRSRIAPRASVSECLNEFHVL